MKIRTRQLPPGWYPRGEAAVRAEIESMLAGEGFLPGEALAGIAPHAGWSFSGAIAAAVVASFGGAVDTLAVVGGHLGMGGGLLAAREEAYETPLGNCTADLELLDYLDRRLSLREDRQADNTVEIQLPLIRHLLPAVKVLALRAAPGLVALDLGACLAEARQALGRRIVVLGSTDLTHYGPNYGFSPHGRGREALRWVKEVNDRRLIESLLELDLEEALKRGVAEMSACSVGGAAAAAEFARRRGAAGGKLLRYASSYDMFPSDSFVGYAGIIYPTPGG
jgi:AmmeMemoRadiSam system protein B